MGGGGVGATCFSFFFFLYATVTAMQHATMTMSKINHNQLHDSPLIFFSVIGSSSCLSYSSFSSGSKTIILTDVDTLATALPLMVPSRLLLITATLAGPPFRPPAMDTATSL